MHFSRILSGTMAFVCAAVVVSACGTPSDAGDEPEGSAEPLLGGLPLPIPGVPDLGHCVLSQAKDTLIAELVKDSWRVKYPLTRLVVNADGTISGPNLPDVLAGQLEVINTVEPARASVARALAQVSGLPDYGMSGISPELPSCLSVPAWTPNGETSVPTTSFEVYPNSVNPASWRAVHKAFAKECPLVGALGNTDAVDPPGDGSTNSPPSRSVSAKGIRANSYGLCPARSEGEYCKLSSASGANWVGRSCQAYYGKTRCLVY